MVLRLGNPCGSLCYRAEPVQPLPTYEWDERCINIDLHPTPAIFISVQQSSSSPFQAVNLSSSRVPAEIAERRVQTHLDSLQDLRESGQPLGNGFSSWSIKMGIRVRYVNQQLKDDLVRICSTKHFAASYERQSVAPPPMRYQ